VFLGALTALVGGAADRPNEWVDAIIDASPAPVDALVGTLAMEQIQARVDPETGQPDTRYVGDLLTRLWEAPLQARIADAASALRRVEHDDPGRAHEIAVELHGLQLELAELRARRE